MFLTEHNQNIILIVFLMCIGVLPACLRAPEALELELQRGESCHVGAMTWHRSTGKVASAPTCQTTSPAPILIVLTLIQSNLFFTIIPTVCVLLKKTALLKSTDLKKISSYNLGIWPFLWIQYAAQDRDPYLHVDQPLFSSICWKKFFLYRRAFSLTSLSVVYLHFITTYWFIHPPSCESHSALVTSVSKGGLKLN